MSLRQNAKLGRNDPCWCGSGKKYKYCHIDRGAQQHPTIQEAKTQIKKAFSREMCLHPLAGPEICVGKIAKAHTIQKSGVLRKISKNGKVYSCTTLSNDDYQDRKRLMPKYTGINKASTFTGFCQYHDSKIFEPIEKGEFRPTKLYAFLLGYRAICREYFTKLAHSKMIPYLKTGDRGLEIFDQIEFQEYINYHGSAVLKGLNDLKHHKSVYDAILLSNDLSDINYYIITIDRTPDIMCSGSIMPEIDFHNNILQDLLNENIILDLFNISIIATPKGGTIILSWAGNQSSCLKLLSSIHNIPHKYLSNSIARLVFEFIENTYFSPMWWESKSLKSKAKIVERIKELGKEGIRSPLRLQPDGIDYVNWKIREIHTNIDL